MVSVEHNKTQDEPLKKTIQIDTPMGLRNVELEVVQKEGMPVDHVEIDLVKKTMTIAPIRVPL